MLTQLQQTYLFADGQCIFGYILVLAAGSPEAGWTMSYLILRYRAKSSLDDTAASDTSFDAISSRTRNDSRESLSGLTDRANSAGRGGSLGTMDWLHF